MAINLALFSGLIGACLSRYFTTPELSAQELFELLEEKGIGIIEADIISQLASEGSTVWVGGPLIANVDNPQRSVPVLSRSTQLFQLNFFRQSLGPELQLLAGMPKLRELRFFDCQLPSSLIFLDELQCLQKLDILECGLTDQQLRTASLTKVVSLRVLNLNGNKAITDDGLERIAVLTSLTELDVSATAVTMIDFVTRLRDLQVLRLWGTAIDDEDVKCLAALPRLHTLCLSETMITDQSIGHLLAMKSLRCLDIRRTAITQEAADELKSRIPDVRWSPGG